ncbi:VacJ lipoprotein [Salmonella enterica subsp. enterica]|uniref:VacJ lipoprotein n=1 Tax=Salmonella enterica I TaxID=59201 RepID=A0A379WPH4_SALET|nr:VacJ lipoprotein [Salmonella enterica subsp. enterica]
MKLRLSALALGTTLLVGCASSGTEQQGRSDPFEGFNRTMYNFNFNVLDPYVVRPVASPGVIMFHSLRVTVK